MTLKDLEEYMKKRSDLLLAMMLVVMTSCIIVPGHGYHHDGYYDGHGHGYHRH